jgi:hypothetical protein
MCVLVDAASAQPYLQPLLPSATFADWYELACESLVDSRDELRISSATCIGRLFTFAREAECTSKWIRDNHIVNGEKASIECERQGHTLVLGWAACLYVFMGRADPFVDIVTSPATSCCAFTSRAHCLHGCTLPAAVMHNGRWHVVTRCAP